MDSTTNIINQSSYLGRQMVDYEALYKLIETSNHLYLFNPELTKEEFLIYIDCTYGYTLSDCTIKVLKFPEKENDKFLSYGEYNRKTMQNKYYTVFTTDNEAREAIRRLKAINLNPPVEFSNGNTANQNYLEGYPTQPVRYQIIIGNRAKLRGKHANDGYDIYYHGEVRIEHYTDWKIIFHIDYDSYAKTFRACEAFIENHMNMNPIYDNE